MLVERSTVSYISRGTAAIFQVSTNNPRETYGGDNIFYRCCFVIKIR
ncbi:MAG: hypothetical protein LBC68_02175 [Prevotellaceae bacterium]|nr:hypothetical protein [Prevotellaceae bacterium]